MSKKWPLLAITMVLITLLITVAINSINNQGKQQEGLKVHSWSSSLGSVGEVGLDETKFSYSFDLTNENEDEIFVESLEPIVNKDIIDRVLSEELEVTVNEKIAHGESIQISGEIKFDTKGLSKKEIVELEPFITDIKVSSQAVIKLK